MLSSQRTLLLAVGLAGLGCTSGPAPSSSSGGAPGITGGADGAGGLVAGTGGGGTATGGQSTGGESSTGGEPGAGGQSSVGGQPSSGGASGGSSGGSGTGGVSGTGGGGAFTSATLVTSGPEDYWNRAATPIELPDGSPELTIDLATKYQKFTGFGGCFNEMGWDALSVLSAAEVTQALTLLFDDTEGANFVYGRLPLGASDYSMSWYTLNETAGDYEMKDFSIARDREKLIPFIKAALAIRPDVKLWASPWVVPSWMMDSSKNMKTDAQTLGAHALYMSRFAEEYAKEGLKISAIHPQNEPGYARVHWTQAGLIDFVKTHLGPTLAANNPDTEVWFGTMSKDPADTNIAKAVALDADAMKYTKGFGVQWNLQAAVATLSAAAPVMQTEHKCGNYNFETPYWDQSRYDPNKPQNDHLYGEESWQLIRDWIVAGVSSYSAWNMVLDTVGKSLDKWPQNALLTVDRTAKKLNITPAYYAFRHYSQYVQPNAIRIAIAGSTDALAFQNPDGSVIAEVYNKGTTAKTTSVGVSGKVFQFTVPSHGWATLRFAP